MFNSAQQSVINHNNGPMLVIAGAGTGKTTVVTQRISRLVEQGLAKPSEILAITFTDKAAFEMTDRVDLLMPLGRYGVNIFTFHGFCEYFLREHAIDIQLSNGFTLLSEFDAVALFKKHLFEFSLDYYRPLGNPGKNIKDMLTHFSRLKDECVAPAEYIAWATDQEDRKYLELAHVYREWEDLKIKKGLMDFGDLIFNSVTVLQNKSFVRKEVATRYKYIMIDEYQDTNYAQDKLVELLINEDQSLVVVCDDDQSIYNWRGSSVSNVMQFRQKFPTASLVVLTENHRSGQRILDSAYKLISYNNPDRLETKEKIGKRLVSTKPDLGSIDYFWGTTQNAEAEWVAEQISNLKLKTTDLGEIAILIRANSQAEQFLQALQTKGISCQFWGAQKLYQKAEIKDLLAWLTILIDETNMQSWYRVLKMEAWHHDTSYIIQILNKVKSEHQKVKDILNPEGDLAMLFGQQTALLQDKSVGEILFSFLQATGLFKRIYENTDAIAVNIAKFMAKVMEFEQNSEYKSVADFLNWVELANEIGESPSVGLDDDMANNNAVNIMTYHGVKGLEFDTVFMVNLVNDRFPSRDRKDGIPIPEALIKEQSPEGDAHLQEERRLFYVGMTRAKRQLYFTGASFYAGNKREKKWSIFVQEALGAKDIPAEGKSFTSEIYTKQTTQEEEKVSFSIHKISHSQIETFQACPVHYKAKYILKLPSGPKAASTFGNIIHSVMKHLAERPDTNVMDLINANWSPLGFESARHNEDAKIKANSYVQSYLKNHDFKSAEISHSEEAFVFPISSDLSIEGKIDRVDDLGNGKIRIVDYKTGEHLPSDKDVAKDLQLSIYALAANKLWGIRPEDIELALYYFAGDKLFLSNRSQEQLDQAIQEILIVRDQILVSDFMCSKAHFCQKCDYSFLCSYGE